MAKSADEVRAERLSVLGPEFGQVYHALCDEVQWLYVKWHEYRKPYATSRERLDLLNSAAPFFFRVVQDVLWDDALLHLARLTDHPKSAGKPNMTVRRLAGVVSDPRLAAEVEHLVGYAVRLCEFARETRHRHLAHRDFDLAVECAGVDPLPPASRQDVGAAMAALAAVLNLIEAHYFGSTTGFAHVSAPGGADGLFYHLALAARVEARIRRGEILPEDLEPPPAC